MSNIKQFPTNKSVEEQASDWIVKLEERTPSEDEIKQFNVWLNENQEHRRVVIALSKTWSNMDTLSGLMLSAKENVTIKRTTLSFVFLMPLLFLLALVRGVNYTLRNLIRPKVVLPLIALSSFSYIVFLNLQTQHANEYATDIGSQLTETLADGSTLWLNSNSKVEIKYSANKRILYLIHGEAHFDVVHDLARPFEVYAGNRMIKAVGTAFSVHRFEGSVKVLVSEGKVDLGIIDFQIDSEPNDIQVSHPNRKTSRSINTIKKQPKVKILTSLEAGQSVSIPAVSSNVTQAIVEYAPGELVRKLSWLDGRLVFAGETLEEVVEEVSRHTAIRIEVADPHLKTLRIGGQFHTGETEALFDVLETGFGIEVNHISKKHVTLHAK